MPFLYVSALTGQRVRKLLDLIGEVAEEREKRIPTAEVNKVLGELVDRNSPPQKAGEEVKLLYASQIGTAPPEFAIVSNRPLDIPESYLRYLIERVPRGLVVHRLAAAASSSPAGRSRR